MKRKRTARRRGRWNELEEKGVEKKGRMDGMEGNDRFPDKGETFSKGRWNEIGLDFRIEASIPMVGSSGLAQRVHL